MTLIIGAAGRARHGKTDFCEAIRDYVIYQQGGKSKLYDIGNMIRLYCIESGRLPQVERKDMTKEQLQILIDVGKECRATNEDFWIGQMMRLIKREDVDVALIPNLRYLNEAKAIRDEGGYVVRMERRNRDGSTFISEDRPPNDVSETNLQFWPADSYIVTVEGQIDLIPSLAIAHYEYFFQRDALNNDPAF